MMSTYYKFRQIPTAIVPVVPTMAEQFMALLREVIREVINE